MLNEPQGREQSVKLVRQESFPGGLSGEVTPVPIPNTAVKLSCADGTARGTLWESRSLPGSRS